MPSKSPILNKIADYLARRDHSIDEIKKKLEQKNYDPQDIQSSLEIAQNNGWFLNPQELSKKVSLSLAHKNRSHFFINQYLKDKGLPETPFDESQEELAIKTQLLKKFKKTCGFKQNEYHKALQFLSHKGFYSETCLKVIGSPYEEL